MKKIISTLLIEVVLFNFILCNRVYADDTFSGTGSIGEDSISAASQEGLVNEGSSSLGKIVWGVLGAIFGTIAGILAAVVDIFPMLIHHVIGMVTGSDGKFTIEQTVFNELALFNVDYFDFNATYTVGTGDHQEVINTNASILALKESVAQFFIITRLIAVAASLLTLIYIGIRMALSTIASEQAKYKKMLVSWVESIAILFLMHYIISIIFAIGEIFGNIAFDLRAILSANGEVSFESVTIDKIYSNMIGNAGWTYVLYSVVYWILVFTQIKFFLMYMKRVVAVGFLILIAPLVTITYPIDKAGDGKAQAFSVWFNELCMNIFIQPIHAFIYLVLMFTAGEIAKQSIFIGLIFLLFLTKVEKIILQLFNLKNVVSLQPVDEQKKK